MKRIVLCSLMVMGLGCSGEAKKPVASNPAPAGASAPTTPASDANPSTAAAPPTKDTSPTPPSEQPAPAASQPAADPMAAAQEAFDANNPDKGLAALEEFHKSTKPTVYSLVMAASFHEMRGRSAIQSDQKAAIGHFERAIESYQKAEKASSNPMLPFTKRQWGAATYDLACAQALTGEPKKALMSLEEAFRLGFDNLDKYASDSDLASVRELPEYEQFVTRARESKKDKPKE